jgi:hypothetical protein
VIDVFIDELDLTSLGFEGVAPAVTGRSAYHPAVAVEGLRLRVSQPCAVQSSPGTGNAAQR